MNLIGPRCERGLSQKSLLQKSTAMWKSSLRLANLCSREKGAGQTTEPSKVPTAGKRSFVVAPMGSGSVGYSTGCRDNLQLNFSRRHFVLSLASLVFSVVGSVCRCSQAYTLTSVLSSLAFGRSSINLAIGDAMNRACLVLHIRTCTYVAASLPSFRNNRNHVTARTNATEPSSFSLSMSMSLLADPIYHIVDYTLWNRGSTIAATF